MADPSTFRGTCGEVVGGFLSPRSLATAAPVALWAVLVGAAAQFAVGRLGLPHWALLPLHVSALSPVIATFAIAARRGRLREGFVESLVAAQGEIAAFSLRHALLSLVWTVPLSLAADGVLSNLAAGVLMGGGRLAGSAALVPALLLAALFLAPTCVVVAARADSLGEALAGWGWLARERRSDLPAFFSSLVGALVVFAAGCLALGALLTALAALVEPSLAAAVAVASWATPAAAAPVLLGRLAGALAADEAEPVVRAENALPLPVGARFGSVAPPEVTSPSSPAVGPPAMSGLRPAAGLAKGRVTGRQSVPVPQGSVTAAIAGHSRSVTLAGAPSGLPTRRESTGLVSVVRAVARVHERAESDPAGALIAAEELAADHPNNPAVAAERARLLRLNGRAGAALAEAGRAITLALSGGAAPIAADVFRAFAMDAVRLGIEPSLLERLARVLVHGRDHASAAWCWRAHAATSGDSIAAQRGLVGVAQAAEHAGHLETARRVLDMFLEDHADSQLADAIRVQRDELERQLGAVAPTA